MPRGEGIWYNCTKKQNEWNLALNIVETDIAGVRILEPQVFGDARGWFSETYNAARYRAAGIAAEFVQDNESF